MYDLPEFRATCLYVRLTYLPAWDGRYVITALQHHSLSLIECQLIALELYISSK